jgi:hypothetical protein
MSTVTRPDISTCRQRSGWNHHAPGLRRLASGFPALDCLHRCEDWLDLGQPFPRQPSLFGDPLAFCLQHHDALLHCIPTSYRSTPQLRYVSVQVRPLLFVSPTRSATQSGGQPVNSQVSTIRFELPPTEVALHRSFRDLLPLASFGQGKMGTQSKSEAIADLRPSPLIDKVKPRYHCFGNFWEGCVRC